MKREYQLSLAAVQTIVCFSFLIVLISCKKEMPSKKPTVEAYYFFKAIPDEEYPIKVSFTNGSKGATEYRWEFGNGIVSTEASPTIDFYSSDDLQVKLIAKNEKEADSFTRLIQIPYRSKSVAIVYMIPKDRSFDPALLKEMELTAPILQEWFKKKTGGKTYRLSTPYVDTFYSDKTSNWFASYQGLGEYGGASDISYYLKNCEEELYMRLYDKINRTKQVVLVYLPVPANVAGISFINLNRWATAIVFNNAVVAFKSATPGYALQIAAHELGHNFGLQHHNHVNAIMRGATGQIPEGNNPCTFPDCSLFENEIAILRANRFFY